MQKTGFEVKIKLGKVAVQVPLLAVVVVCLEVTSKKKNKKIDQSRLGLKPLRRGKPGL